ncbi:tetratricopeptide repeat protein [Methanobrevibacter arboriphilus]|uniref:tetratricopeptide repeat protein n=1 Tax=Methanobrevibacter arboriphilus TaxID=39441 RepID=UPI000A5C3D1F|nr:tetratricopeptide repeat protein [Methanobrevibacter arboriphilus]
MKRKFNKAREYREANEYDKALKIYNELLEKDYNLLDTYFNLGLIFLFKKDYDMAIRYFDDALSLDENNSRILSEKSAALYSLNHKKRIFRVN